MHIASKKNIKKKRKRCWVIITPLITLILSSSCPHALPFLFHLKSCMSIFFPPALIWISDGRKRGVVPDLHTTLHHFHNIPTFLIGIVVQTAGPTLFLFECHADSFWHRKYKVVTIRITIYVYFFYFIACFYVRQGLEMHKKNLETILHNWTSGKGAQGVIPKLSQKCLFFFIWGCENLPPYLCKFDMGCWDTLSCTHLYRCTQR